MSEMGAPVRVVKAGDKSISMAKVEVAAVSTPGKKVEPEAQLVEVEPGVYDITFTCSCGERTVLRCYSLEGAGSSKPSVAPAASSVKAAAPTPPPSPAKPAMPPPPSAAPSKEA